MGENDSAQEQALQELHERFGPDIRLGALCEMIEQADLWGVSGVTAELRKTLEEARARGDLDAVFEIGMLFGRLGASICYKRLWKEPWKRVNKTTRKLLAAAAQNAHPAEKIVEALRLYDERVKRGGKKTMAQRWVREKTGVPESVLRYHLAKRKKQPKNL